MEFFREFKSSYEQAEQVAREAHNFIYDNCKIKNKKTIFNINLALRELLNNSVSHGNKFDEKKNVELNINFNNNILEIEVTDQGDGFIIDKKLKDCKDPFRERCRGIWILVKLGFDINKIGSNKILARLKINSCGVV